jgi:hypothetical protein
VDTLVLNAGLFQLFAFEEIEDVSKARNVMVNVLNLCYQTSASIIFHRIAAVDISVSLP